MGGAPPAAAPRVLHTPASAVLLALADVQTLPREKRPWARYVSAYPAEEKDLPALAKALSFVVNSLSRNNVPVPPAPVPNAGGRLWRLDLREYCISRRSWGDLAKKGSGRAPFPEPYFHLALRHSGKLAQAPWLPEDEAALLSGLTGSVAPVLRADWFAWNATLEPRYHELLGLPETEAELQKLFDADVRTTDELGVQVRGAVLRSEVAPNARGLERLPTRLRHGRGYYWRSVDSGSSIEADDAVGDLLTKGDAHEIIFSLPNGLQGYYITDGAGKRVDRADTKFARDRRNPFNWVEVEIRNCFTCHALGMIPVRDAVREEAGGPLALALQKYGEKDPDRARRIRDRYFAADLGQLITADQQSFAAAVKATNGLSPGANALALLQVLLRYEADLKLDGLPAETGYPKEIVLGVLERAGGTGLDHSASRLARPGTFTRRDQWEAKGMGQLMRLLLKVPTQKPPPKARGG